MAGTNDIRALAEEHAKEVSRASVRYSKDKPKSCEYCYYWKGRQAGCSLGERNCFYIIHDKENIKNDSGQCNNCPYSKHSPCIGWCTRAVRNSILENCRAIQNGQK